MKATHYPITTTIDPSDPAPESDITTEIHKAAADVEDAAHRILCPGVPRSEIWPAMETILARAADLVMLLQIVNQNMVPIRQPIEPAVRVSVLEWWMEKNTVTRASLEKCIAENTAYRQK